MFSINDTFIIFLVSFLVFVYLLNKFFIRPVGQTIDKRNRMIDEQRQATAELWKEAAGLIAKQEAELADAREHAHAILKEIEKSIQAQRENVLSELPIPRSPGSPPGKSSETRKQEDCP